MEKSCRSYLRWHRQGTFYPGNERIDMVFTGTENLFVVRSWGVKRLFLAGVFL